MARRLSWNWPRHRDHNLYRVYYLWLVGGILWVMYINLLSQFHHKGDKSFVLVSSLFR